MRKVYICIALLTLITTACKKENMAPVTPEPSAFLDSCRISTYESMNHLFYYTYHPSGRLWKVTENTNGTGSIAFTYSGNMVTITEYASSGVKTAEYTATLNKWGLIDSLNDTKEKRIHKARYNPDGHLTSFETSDYNTKMLYGDYRTIVDGNVIESTQVLWDGTAYITTVYSYSYLDKENKGGITEYNTGNILQLFYKPSKNILSTRMSDAVTYTYTYQFDNTNLPITVTIKRGGLHYDTRRYSFECQ